MFAEDALRVGARGDIQHGRAEIQQAYQRMFTGPFAGAQVTIRDGSLRMLGNGLALWRSGIEIVPSAGPPLPGCAVDLLESREGRWWISESHPKLFPPPAP
jgi:uncharacterized protein (TIGR02246 family)